MSFLTQTDKDTKLSIIKRNRQALFDRLAGFNNEQIAIRRGIPPGQVDDAISTALEDTKSNELHSGVRAEIINRLIKDIQDMDRWEKELAPTRTREYQTLDVNANVVTLSEQWDKDREIITKYKTEKRHLYSLLEKMLKAEPEGETDDSKHKINNAILDALVTVAERKGSLEEKIRKDNQKIVNNTIDLNSEDEDNDQEEEDNG